MSGTKCLEVIKLVTVEEAKDYLNIPDDFQDSMIAGMLQNGYDYLENAVDDFNKLYENNAVFARQADSFVKFHWFPVQYDQREGMCSNDPSLNYAARSLLTQLQMYEFVEEVN